VNDPRARPVDVPIYPSVSYEFADAAAWEAFLEDPSLGYIYTRWANPTTRAIEARLARLEGAETARLLGSGLGAIAAVALALAAPGRRVLHATGLYGGTYHLLYDILGRFGVEVAPGDEPDGRTAFLYAETISNPTLGVADLEALAARARAAGCPLVVDNTIATPHHCRPVERGAAIVCESATKALGGHGDLMAGVVAGRADLVDEIDRGTARNLGAVSSPHDAWLLGRGLKTFALRAARQSATALGLARALEGDGRVRRVLYPGLPSHPDHALAARTLAGGFGALVTLDLGSLERAKAFIDALRVIRRAASLGGVESLVSIPVLSSHYKIPPAALEREGVTPGMVRLSFGIEEPADLRADLDRGLAAAAGRG